MTFFRAEEKDISEVVDFHIKDLLGSETFKEAESKYHHMLSLLNYGDDDSALIAVTKDIDYRRLFSHVKRKALDELKEGIRDYSIFVSTLKNKHITKYRQETYISKNQQLNKKMEDIISLSGSLNSMVRLMEEDDIKELHKAYSSLSENINRCPAYVKDNLLRDKHSRLVSAIRTFGDKTGDNELIDGIVPSKKQEEQAYFQIHNLYK